MTSPSEIPSSAAAFARLPILDARRQIAACELVDNGPPPDAPAAAKRDADLLLHALALCGQHGADPRRLMFVRCHPETLADKHLALVDPKRIVIELALPAQADPAAIDAMVPVLADVLGRGFRLALRHDALASVWHPWLLHASYLFIDMNRLPPGALPAIVKATRRQADLQLVACGVADHAQQAQAQAAGIDWFQGPFFTQPAWVRSQVLRPSQATVLELIGLVRRDADMDHIETLLKRDPALSFNLLRFINTSGLGLSCEITSFAHAVMILGMDKLLRWACLLMATARDGASPAVAHTAVVRGRLMELLAADLFTPEECDHAFVAGVFSLLDALTGVPTDLALEGLPLPDAVVGALLGRSGPLAPLLELTEACERADDAAFAHAAQSLALSGHQVNMAHLQALAWADELLAA